MTNTLASITFEDDITIITLNDGNVNAFSYDMLTQVHRLLDEVPQKSGALIIKGRNGIFSGGFDLKTLASGDLSKITKMIESGYNLILKLYSFVELDPRAYALELAFHRRTHLLFHHQG